jgi:hypothetical protein
MNSKLVKQIEKSICKRIELPNKADYCFIKPKGTFKIFYKNRNAMVLRHKGLRIANNTELYKALKENNLEQYYHYLKYGNTRQLAPIKDLSIETEDFIIFLNVNHNALNYSLHVIFKNGKQKQIVFNTIKEPNRHNKDNECLLDKDSKHHLILISYFKQKNRLSKTEMTKLLILAYMSEHKIKDINIGANELFKSYEK